MESYGDAQNIASKYLVGLNDYLFRPLFYTHISTSNYLLPVDITDSDYKSRYKTDNIFSSNEQIWDAIISEKLRRTDVNIVLDKFNVFDWFPRSPGLYHTNDAKYAREEAYHRILSSENGLIVFDPYGKHSMLEGGIGNIRLKPINLDGNEYVFLSASSNSVCHEGFPVAMPIEMYNKCLDEISENGIISLSLIGKLKFIPDKYVNLYHFYSGVPQMYLLINDIIYPKSRIDSKKNNLKVSIAVSFISNFEYEKKIYATYVNFNPSDKISFKDSVRWMEEDYVLRKYNGQIVTDFDERMVHFRDANFSLSKVMNLKIEEADYAFVSNYIHSREFLENQNHLKIEIGAVYMGSKYNITGGQQGAVGDNAQASNFQMVWNQLSSAVDLDKLALELQSIREKGRAEVVTANDEVSIGNIASAEIAAKEKDGVKVVEYLKKAGQWALNVATKIGAQIAVKAIKESLGLH